MRDDSGQVILMMAIIVAIGLVVLLVYLNQTSMAGHSSASSIMGFPKNDIRELKGESMAEAYRLGRMINDNTSYNAYSVDDRGKKRSEDYVSQFERYNGSVSRAYAEKGCLVSVASEPGIINGSIANATFAIRFDNGETRYSENMLLLI